jgi:Transcriptional Coactivator p15 (PC4)
VKKVWKITEGSTLDKMAHLAPLSQQWMLGYPPTTQATMFAALAEKSVFAAARRTARSQAAMTNTLRTRSISLRPIAWLSWNISACLRSLYHLITEKLLRMSKTFNIGEKRDVTVKKLNGEWIITIAESDSELKTVTFPSMRWVHLTSLIDQIEESLNLLKMKQPVEMKLAIGGKWYVSVTSGYLCVDIREFYFHPVLGLRPTKKGIALRVKEFIALKDVIRLIFVKYPILKTITPCYMQASHQNQEGMMTCSECSPYQFEEKFFSIPTI